MGRIGLYADSFIGPRVSTAIGGMCMP